MPTFPNPPSITAPLGTSAAALETYFTACAAWALEGGQVELVFADTRTSTDTVTLSNVIPIWMVKDQYGNAAVNNIFVVAPPGINIDGGTEHIISTNYGRAWFAWNGTGWNIIG